MAEAVLFTIADGIIANLGSSAVKAILRGSTGPLSSVRDEIRKLQNTVFTIKAVLLDAEEQQAKNHQAKVWLERLTDALYETDDLLDDISTQSMLARLYFSSLNKLAFAINMSYKLKAARKKLNEVAEDRKFHLQECLEEKQVYSRTREESYSVMSEMIIGRERDEEEMLNMLLNFGVDKDLSVISIVGIGGLGKTALAQLVFNDEKVKMDFDTRIWTCVSDNFAVKSVVGKILEAMGNDRVGNLEMNTMVTSLNKNICGKKYLLVLDDMWNEDREKWLRFEALLKGGAQGSKIVVTTRSDIVAKTTNASSIYHLGGLTEHGSWALFKHVAFQQDNQAVDPNLERIGKEILDKCDGVPLVIRTIGSLLYHEKTEEEWLYFKNNELLEIDENGDKKILSTLLLSYNHLPSHLKHCFGYCSLFPKDCFIDKDKLVKLWMAQGFIRSSDKKRCLGVVGHRYFMDLLERGFFHDAELNGRGDITRFKLHSIMHELAVHVAGDESILLNLRGEGLSERTRHLSINFMLNSSWKLPTLLAKGKYLRTFLLPSQSYSLIGLRLDTIFPSFKCLRVLDLHSMDISKVPGSVDKLRHLRYLDLSNNSRMKTLPSSITGLLHLQTLKLNYCEGIRELPSDMKRLVNLRHLELKGCTLKFMPPALGSLSQLETLTSFFVDKQVSKHSSALSELKVLNNLAGELTIENLGHGLQDKLDIEAANLKDKKGLNYLGLCWNGKLGNDAAEVEDKEMLESLQRLSNLKGLQIWYYNSIDFPRWMMSNIASCLPNLVEIDLFCCRSCISLPPLQQLSYLKCLKLQELSHVEYIDEGYDAVSESESTFFPSLEKLELLSLSNLRGWWKDVGTTENMLSFPCLSLLCISGCPNLMFMPLQPHLRELELGEVEKDILQEWFRMVKISPAAKKTSTQAACTTFSASCVPQSSSSSRPQLEKLTISHVSVTLRYLPEGWLHNLNFLKELNISYCSGLVSIPDLSCLASLRVLEIYACENLKALPQKIHHLLALEELGLGACTQLDLSLDESGPHFKTLCYLEIKNMPQMVCLPIWLQHVASLKRLKIVGCNGLKNLPDWMRNLSFLQQLEISDCSNLKERCKGTGADWPLISHIQYIEINGDLVKQNPHYYKYKANSTRRDSDISSRGHSSRLSVTPSSL